MQRSLTLYAPRRSTLGPRLQGYVTDTRIGSLTAAATCAVQLHINVPVNLQPAVTLKEQTSHSSRLHSFVEFIVIHRFVFALFEKL